MINMIKADTYRIVRSTGIYIALALMLLMIAMSIYVVEPGRIMVNVNTNTVVENDLSNMSYDEVQDLSLSDYRKLMLKTKGYQLDRDILAYNMNLYYIFIFVAVLVVTMDFSGSCAKNTLSSAISRKKYFLSKLASVTLCCMVLFFLNTYIVYFANIIFNNKNLASDIGTVTKISLLQLPPILALVSFLTGLAFVLKRTAIFNTITIPFFLIGQTLLSFAFAAFKIPDKYFNYEVQKMLVNLADDPSKEYILKSFLLCAVVIVVCNVAGWMFFRKAEIK